MAALLPSERPPAHGEPPMLADTYSVEPEFNLASQFVTCKIETGNNHNKLKGRLQTAIRTLQLATIRKLRKERVPGDRPVNDW